MTRTPLAEKELIQWEVCFWDQCRKPLVLRLQITDTQILNLV